MILFEEILLERSAPAPPRLSGYPMISWAAFYTAAKYAAVGESKYLYPRPGISKDAEFMFDSKEEFLEQYERIQSIFHALPDPTPIYRFVRVDKPEDLNIASPGSHWTWSTENWRYLLSNAVDGYQKKLTYLITATIPKRYIDWKGTVGYYCTYVMTYGNSEDYAENELYIPDQSHITNAKATLYDHG